MTASNSLIVTLQLDAASFAFFDALRQRHFPRQRNYLRAHLTLFHHLPGQELERIRHRLEELRSEQGALTLAVTEVKGMGRGVAYKLECAELQDLHRRLQRAWQEWLTPQDSQKLWPHVTVQNKVDPAQAKQLQQELAAAFKPFAVTGTGLQVWSYLEGPWELLYSFEFKR